MYATKFFFIKAFENFGVVTGKFEIVEYTPTSFIDFDEKWWVESIKEFIKNREIGLKLEIERMAFQFKAYNEIINDKDCLVEVSENNKKHGNSKKWIWNTNNGSQQAHMLAFDMNEMGEFNQHRVLIIEEFINMAFSTVLGIINSALTKEINSVVTKKKFLSQIDSKNKNKAISLIFNYFLKALI